MKLKKLELHQETLRNLTHRAQNQKVHSGNPDCSFIISCPRPCVGDLNPRNHDANPRNQ